MPEALRPRTTSRSIPDRGACGNTAGRNEDSAHRSTGTARSPRATTCNVSSLRARRAGVPLGRSGNCIRSPSSSSTPAAPGRRWPRDWPAPRRVRPATARAWRSRRDRLPPLRDPDCGQRPDDCDDRRHERRANAIGIDDGGPAFGPRSKTAARALMA